MRIIPIGMYKELIELYENNEVDFSDTTIFNLDEYCKSLTEKIFKAITHEGRVRDYTGVDPISDTINF